MTKQEIIDKLNAGGVTFDPTANKADLEALLKSSAVPPGDTGDSTAGSGKPTDSDAPAGSDAPGIAGEVEVIAERETLPESEIVEKVRAGLDRQQAIEVINRQREHDGKDPLSVAEIAEAGGDAGDIPAAEIAVKVHAGLERDQAIEVIRNQRAHDAAQATGETETEGKTL